jgi:hypothetical protein
MPRSRFRAQLSSIWYCPSCRVKPVAMGLPKRLKCSRCAGPLTFLEAVKPAEGRWPFGRPPHAEGR